MTTDQHIAECPGCGQQFIGMTPDEFADQHAPDCEYLPGAGLRTATVETDAFGSFAVDAETASTIRAAVAAVDRQLRDPNDTRTDAVSHKLRAERACIRVLKKRGYWDPSRV